MNKTYPHIPVLLKEILQAFKDCQLDYFIDATLGAGGHAESILSSHPEIIQYIGIDQDPNALNIAKERLSPWKEKILFIQSNFSSLEEKLSPLPLVNGILVDLGVSSMQLDTPERGFSFMKDGPLDMRMNPENRLTAAEVVNKYREQELSRIFWEYGEDRKSRKAAKLIVEARRKQRIETTQDLVKVLQPICPPYRGKGIHPLTLIFQGLRIYVNQELEVLKEFLSKALQMLAPEGIMAVISFHSLEDRIVKNFFREEKGTIEIVTKKPLVPTLEEMRKNPRSRSAKLRIARKKP